MNTKKYFKIHLVHTTWWDIYFIVPEEVLDFLKQYNPYFDHQMMCPGVKDKNYTFNELCTEMAEIKMCSANKNMSSNIEDYFLKNNHGDIVSDRIKFYEEKSFSVPSLPTTLTLNSF